MLQVAFRHNKRLRCTVYLRFSALLEVKIASYLPEYLTALSGAGKADRNVVCAENLTSKRIQVFCKLRSALVPVGKQVL